VIRTDQPCGTDAEEAKREDFYFFGLMGSELFFGSVTESNLARCSRIESAIVDRKVSADPRRPALSAIAFLKIAKLRGIGRIHAARYRAER